VKSWLFSLKNAAPEIEEPRFLGVDLKEIKLEELLPAEPFRIPRWANSTPFEFVVQCPSERPESIRVEGVFSKLSCDIQKVCNGDDLEKIRRDESEEGREFGSF
jgi:hypothetical protein